MYELSVTRLIDAAPAKVWDTMVNRANDWWCPQPWRAEMDFGARRPGAMTLATMFGPNGEVNKHPGFILAWDEGVRFAFTDAISGDLQPAGPFMLGIFALAPEPMGTATGTRYNACARHWTPESMAHHREMGFETGWGICADQLKALCEASA